MTVLGYKSKNLQQHDKFHPPLFFKTEDSWLPQNKFHLMTAFKSLSTRVLPPAYTVVFSYWIWGALSESGHLKNEAGANVKGERGVWAPAVRLCRAPGTWGARCGQSPAVGKMLMRTFLGYWRVRSRTPPPNLWVSSRETRKKLRGQKEDAPLPPSFQSGEGLLYSREQKDTCHGPTLYKLLARGKGREVSGSPRWRPEAGAAEARLSRGWVGTYQRSEHGWWRCPGLPQRLAGAAWWRRSQPRGRSSSRPRRRALRVPPALPPRPSLAPWLYDVQEPAHGDDQ